MKKENLISRINDKLEINEIAMLYENVNLISFIYRKKYGSNNTMITPFGEFNGISFQIQLRLNDYSCNFIGIDSLNNKFQNSLKTGNLSIGDSEILDYADKIGHLKNGLYLEKRLSEIKSTFNLFNNQGLINNG